MNTRTSITSLKSFLALSILLVAIGILSNANAAPILLGGYYGSNENAQQSPSASNEVAVTLTRTGPSADITQGYSQVSTSAMWGTNALDAAPLDNNSPANHAICQTQTTDPFTFVLTVTNTANETLDLNAIHYWLKKDIANVGPNSGTLTYTSGDLDDSDGTSTNFSIANGINAYDHTLSDFLTDTILATGEAATFTWAHGAPQDPGGNTAIRLDNFAISGEFIPPPAGAVFTFQ